MALPPHALLLVLCALTGLIRSAIAYRGGIWADEGFFLSIVASPTWESMLGFLHYHESHPPFFYALVRLWVGMAGNGDAAVLILPIVLATMIVPLTYFVGSRTFSTRCGLLAATLCAISAPLSEHASQARPYGLLALLVLASCHALARSIADGGAKWWSAYIGSTTLLLYTHNWSWLIAFGQVVAVCAIAWDGALVRDRKVVFRFGLALSSVGLLYLPWLDTFLYQVKHAGHGPEPSSGLIEFMERTVVQIPLALKVILVGSVSDRYRALPIAAVLLISVLTALRASALLRRVWGRSPSDRLTPHALIAKRLFMIVPCTAIFVAIAFSPVTNLFLPRCLSVLTPPALILVAAWTEESISRGGEASAQRSQLATIAMALLIIGSLFSIAYLVRTPRSNAREVAETLKRHVLPSDLVIVAPEWYSTEFNHYFNNNVEQIDFPSPSRVSRVDFSDVFARVSNQRPIEDLKLRIEAARAAGRRVWFVSGRNYVRPVMGYEIADATRHRKWWMFSAIRVFQIRSELEKHYGNPDTTFFLHEFSPRYDELLPFLYRTNPETMDLAF